jgi:hypothetical protein
MLAYALPSVAGECKYYAFVDHGVVASNQKKVFRSSGVRMYQPGLITAYDARGELNKDGFTMVQLGPYANSAIAKKALKKKLADLNGQGFVKKTGNQGMPRIYLLNKKLCNG